MSAQFDTSKSAAVTSGSSMTITNFTIAANSNRYVTVKVGHIRAHFGATSAAPTSVTLNTPGTGTVIHTLTKKAERKQAFNANTDDWVSMWEFTAPTAGTYDVVVTWGEAQSDADAAISSWHNIDQSTPSGTAALASNSNSDPSSNTASGAVGDVMIEGLSSMQPTITATGTGQTQVQVQNNINSEASGALSRIDGAASVTFTSTFGAGGFGDCWVSIAFAIKGLPDPTIEQEGFRFRNDDGNETSATWLGAQDANVTQPVSTNTRLRMLLNATLDPASISPQLEFKKSTDPTYTKIEADGGGSLAYGTIGSNTTTGTTAPSVAYPASIAAGDLLVLVIANRPNAQTPATPSGWTAPSNNTTTGGAGSEAADTGTIRLTVFTKIADGTESGSLSLSITSGTSCGAVMFRCTKTTGRAWDVALANGSDNSAGTSFSVTFGSDPGVTSGDLVFIAAANCTDTGAFGSEALSQTGVTYGAYSEKAEFAVTTGNDLRLIVGQFPVSSGTSSAAAVYTATASGTNSGNTAGPAIMIRLRQVAHAIQLAASSNITAGGDNTTAQLTAPSGKTSGSDFQTGRMTDDENPADAIDLGSGKYSEYEWCIAATSSAINGDVYQFRVTKSGTVLDTYTVTPEWTIGTAAAGAMTGVSRFSTISRGTLTATGSLSGASNVTERSNGTLSGAGALTGASNVTERSSGTIGGAGTLLGPSINSDLANATLSALGALSGRSHFTISEAGTLTGPGALTGTSSNAESSNATLTGKGALGGASSFSFTDSGVLGSSNFASGTSVLSHFLSRGNLTNAGAALVLPTFATITFPPDWNSPVNLTIRHRTEIFEALDLSEERLRRLPRPTYGISYSTVALEPRQQGSLRKLFELSQEKPIGVPLWTEAVRLTEDTAGGSTDLNVTSTATTLFQVFNYAIIWADWDHWEIVEVDSVASALLSLSVATENAWPKNTQVIPLAIGYAKRPDFSGLSSEASQVPIDFEEVFNRSLNQKGTLDA